MISDNIAVTEQTITESPEVIIDGVLSHHVPLFWNQAWPWLQKAIKRFPQVRRKMNAPRILNDLAHSRAQLWIAWDREEGKCIGAILTEVTLNRGHPDKVLLEIPLVGGTRWNEWGDEIWNLLKAWGRAQGCTHVVAYGRKGWMRLYGFEHYGETDDGIAIMYRELKEH